MKNKVLALAKKQGATVEILDPYSNGEIEVCVMLPEGKIWDNGYGGGVIVVTLELGQSITDFWADIYSEMDSKVIASE
jgi:hypothetical protein